MKNPLGGLKVKVTASPLLSLSVLVVTTGLALWLAGLALSREQAPLLAELGAGIAGGAVVGFVIYLFERDADERARRQAGIEETQRRASDERLQIQLAWVAARDLSGVDLSGRDLTAISIPNRTMKGAILKKTCLVDASLSNCDLSDADLTDADLRRANLTGADLRKAILHGADLRGARLTHATLYGTNLGKARLDGALMGHANLCKAWLGGACLMSADLRHADLSDAKLHGADITDAYIRGINISRANFTGVNVTGVEGGHGRGVAIYDLDDPPYRVEYHDGVPRKVTATGSIEPGLAQNAGSRTTGAFLRRLANARQPLGDIG